jgi:ABC-type multidrug transport system fused ATPase/permease subunit
MINPITYLLENISWYAPIYNISWIIFIISAFFYPWLALLLFRIPLLKKVLEPASFSTNIRTSYYLVGAAFAIFSFRLIPYWIFNDKILHFLGGGISIALIYEYLIINFQIKERNQVISLLPYKDKRTEMLIANSILLLLFMCFFSVTSEMYEFISKYFAGVQFDSSGLDTWLDIIYNIAGGYAGYFMLIILKSLTRVIRRK